LLINLVRKYRLYQFGHLIAALLWPALIASGISYAGSLVFPAAGEGWSHLIPALLIEGAIVFLLLLVSGYFKPLSKYTRRSAR